eukprot:PDM66522.1 hypothetical protein PRIPAC_47939 [Pristionchus pacificus]
MRSAVSAARRAATAAAAASTISTGGGQAAALSKADSTSLRARAKALKHIDEFPLCSLNWTPSLESTQFPSIDPSERRL